MNIKGGSGKQSSIGTATSLLTTYMKKVYDPLIKKNIDELLDDPETKPKIDENIDAILIIYNKIVRSYGTKLSYNSTDPSQETEQFFDNIKAIVRHVYKTIYVGDVIDEKFVEKITAILFSNNRCHENLRTVITIFLRLETQSSITKYIEAFAQSLEDNIDFTIDYDTNIPFKLSDDLTNFNNTFAWDFFSREKAHVCVVNKWLRNYKGSRDENINCLKNYLTIIYRVFYSFQFINNVEDDEYNDAKKVNNKIKIIQQTSSELLPYAPVTVTSNNKKSWFQKVSFSIKTETDMQLNHTQLNQNPTELIQANQLLIIDDEINNIKVCSYNLNWANKKSKIISHHINNIFGSDILLLQEFNKNNTEILNKPLIKDSYPVNLMFSKDVYNILQKQRMKDVISKYYEKSDRSNNTYSVPLYKYNGTESALNNYKIIYFPNRVSKDINVKLNAIMYDTNKIKITEVFVGLLDSNKYLKHRHFCLCCKYEEEGNAICVINIHLDTDYGKKIPISEIKYLFSEIIRKEPFFRNIDRYIIGGDFNIDAYDIAIELIKMQKNFKKKQHELALFHKKILFNNIVTRGGLLSCDPSINKDKAKYNGMNLDNIIIFDRNIIPDNSINTYVGYNRKSGTTTDYFNPANILCHGIYAHLEEGSTEKQKEEYCKTHFSDHSPIFAAFPKIAQKEQITQMDISEAQMDISEAQANSSSVIEENRNIQLLSKRNKLKLLETLLNDFSNVKSPVFKGKYINILQKHIHSGNPNQNKRQRPNETSKLKQFE